MGLKMEMYGHWKGVRGFHEHMGLNMEIYGHWKGAKDSQKHMGLKTKHHGHCRYLSDCLWHREDHIGVQWKLVNMGEASSDYHKLMELIHDSNVN